MIIDNIEPIVRFLNARDSEQAFVTSHRFTTITSGGGTANFHLKNPSDSGHNIDIHAVAIPTHFKGHLEIFDTFDSGPSGGTAVGIDNLRMGSDNGTPDSGSMEAYHSATFSATNTHWTSDIEGGQIAGAGSIGGTAAATEPIIEPGREIIYQITNDGDTDESGSVGIVYSEQEA